MIQRNTCWSRSTVFLYLLVPCSCDCLYWFSPFVSSHNFKSLLAHICSRCMASYTYRYMFLGCCESAQIGGRKLNSVKLQCTGMFICTLNIHGLRVCHFQLTLTMCSCQINKCYTFRLLVRQTLSVINTHDSFRAMVLIDELNILYVHICTHI